MNHLNNIPSFDSYFTGLYCGSLDLPEQTYKFSVSGQQSEYQGMSVQTLNAPFPVYHNPSDTHKNFAGSINSLNKYTINSSTLAASANTFANDIPEIPQSALDQYVPWNSDDQQFHYTLPSTSDIPFIQQLCLSGSEPEIREPASVSYLNPDNKLTHFPVIPDNPEDLQPTAVANPLSLNQTTRAQGIVDGNSSIVKHKKALQNNPACPGNQRGLQRKCHKNDSSYAERQRMRQRVYKKKRYMNDPDFAERLKKYQREYQRERRKDPAYLEYLKLRQRELRKDPAFSERERALGRQRYKNPDYANCQKALSREWQRNRRQDPAYLEREKGDSLWIAGKDPNYSKRKKSAVQIR
ncbi:MULTISPECIES: hypothetical protein [unclassified Endozoicomonas]|uniref:hypothetical protein n=2 Tax=Endozoicomonas TaxID=305899 RepID=UPI003BB51149